jgi:hypothetical protein
MTRIDFYTDRIFHELNHLAADSELLEAAKTCIEAQKRAGGSRLASRFVPDPKAKTLVSAEALDAILQSGRDVSDVRTDRAISNCLIFNSATISGAVLDEDVKALRRRADELVSRKVARLFRQGPWAAADNSGHFWYPPGGYMSWHTNTRTPGWRLYINYCEEPGKSFFRYRDPDRLVVVDSIDKQWNFRMFRIAQDKPLWHAIYSDTNRFSLGYRITLSGKPARAARVKNRLTNVLAGRS